MNNVKWIFAAALLLASAGQASACDSRSLRIYFMYGTASLTTDAQAVADAGIKLAKECPATRITLTAHDDAVEAAGPLRKESALRLRVVRNYLVRHGVAKRIIKGTDAAGTNPAVASAPGEKEPLNRFVEIIVE